MQSRRSVRIAPLLASIVFVLLVALAWTKNQAIYDWWRLRNYQPPAAITQLARDTTMNTSTERLFYVYHPELQTRERFNESCSGSEQTIVLGCYVSRHGIYLFNVSDERLKGVIQVTAAHEVLHAAYERLGNDERRRVDAMTAAAFDKLTDTRVLETVEAYRKRDPNIVPNELHSILATEVVSLPEDLEEYYKRYFNDRAAVVRYSQQYEQEFKGRQARVDAADARLRELKPLIENLESSLKTQVKSVNDDYERLQSLRRSNQIEAYNAGVAGYNAKVSAYNNSVRKLQNLINEYNALVAERNALAVEENELIKAIDSRPTTIEAQ
jgi:hypothetical protein